MNMFTRQNRDTDIGTNIWTFHFLCAKKGGGMNWD